MGLALIQCTRLELRLSHELRLDGSWMSGTALPRSARVLHSDVGAGMTRAVEAFLKDEWTHNVLDYLLGLLVPPSRGPILRFHAAAGPNLRGTSSEEEIAALDRALAEALRAIAIGLVEVGRQLRNAKPAAKWQVTCDAAGLESRWYCAEVPSPAAAGASAAMSVTP